VTRDEVLARCTWDEYNFATLRVPSRLFGREVEVRFDTGDDPERRVTDAMIASLDHVLDLTEADLGTLKNLLWADCKDAFEATSYGVDVLPGETETEANHRDFGIRTPDDAYAQSRLVRVRIKHDPELRHRYAALDFESPWDMEHGCSVVMKNGKLIARYSHDVWFGRYEDD